MKRIKYYGNNDLSVSWYLDKINTRLSCINNNEINDCLELYNCYLYFKNFPDYNFHEDDKVRLKKTIEILGKYFSSISNENIIELLKKVNSEYMLNFLELLIRFEKYKVINDDKFEVILNEKIIPISIMCCLKKIVNNFSGVVSKYLRNNIKSTEVIIDIMIGDLEGILPQDIENDVANDLISTYINSEYSHYNYLLKIIEAAPYQGFSIYPQNKIEANKKIEEIKNKYFNENQYIKYSCIIKYKDIPQVKFIESNKNETHIYFDYNYLKSNLDYPTILNNFIWLFEYMDFNGNLICVLNNRNGRIQLEDVMQLKLPNNYPISYAFKCIEMMQIATMEKYYQFLQNNKINIELILKWFFEEYLSNEFDVTGLIFLISTSTTYREKCLNLVTNIESVLNQFQCYIMFDKVDLQLIHLSSNTKPFKDMISCISDKYINCTDRLTNIYNLFFYIHPTSINFIEFQNSDHKTFIELLLDKKKRIVLTKETEEMNVLKKLNLLNVKDNGTITLGNKHLIKFIKLLYENKSLSLHRLSELEKETAEILCKENLIYKTSTLFSTVEAELFDYYLNNKSFSNGYSLRNAYAHGKNGYLNEEEHYDNYILLLRIIIMIILKLNEELCLFNK